MLSADWRDWPLTPGTWRYVTGAQGTAAEYGPAGTRLFTLACDRATRTVQLMPERSGGDTLTVRTSDITRVLRKQAAGNPPLRGSVSLAASDRLLDAMTFSRGRVVIEQAGVPPLVLPAWAEIGRVVEDCRG